MKRENEICADASREKKRNWRYESLFIQRHQRAMFLPFTFSSQYLPYDQKNNREKLTPSILSHPLIMQEIEAKIRAQLLTKQANEKMPANKQVLEEVED